MSSTISQRSYYDDLVEQAAATRTQIADLQTKLADILSLQNTLVPVGCLPDDALFHIFSFLVPLFDVPRHDMNVRTICGVSRRWRTLAVAFPEFWNQIPTWREVSAIETALQRSGIIPLDIISRRNFDSVPAYNLLSAESHRIRSLVIKSDGEGPEFSPDRPQPMSPTATKLLGTAMHSPVLEHLKLSCVDYNPQDLLLPASASHTLRRLDVYNSSLDLPLSCTRFVTYFGFSYDGDASTTSDHVPSLVQILSRMPNLETLFIYRSTRVDGRVPRASLPKLKLFKADQPGPYNLPAIITSLDIPDTARFLIISDTWAAFPPLTATSMFCGVSSLELHPPQRDESCLVLRALRPGPPADRKTVRAEVVLREPLPIMSLATVRTATVAGGAPVLKRFTVSGIRLWLGRANRRLVGRGIPDCETLVLEGCSMGVLTAVLEALSGDDEEHAEGDPLRPPFCASLRTIEVLGLEEDEESGEPDRAACRAALERMRARRAARGIEPPVVTVFGGQDLPTVGDLRVFES